MCPQPNQSLARHFAPAPAPAHVPKQAAAPQPTASATPEQTTKELYTSQVHDAWACLLRMPCLAIQVPVFRPCPL